MNPPNFFNQWLDNAMRDVFEPSLNWVLSHPIIYRARGRGPDFFFGQRLPYALTRSCPHCRGMRYDNLIVVFTKSLWVFFAFADSVAWIATVGAGKFTRLGITCSRWQRSSFTNAVSFSQSETAFLLIRARRQPSSKDVARSKYGIALSLFTSRLGTTILIHSHAPYNGMSFLLRAIST
jgi:hypothetical protein